MNKMNKKGFTLIEMLVVIAIIAVLVSIIIPVVGNSTAKAAAATNAANLRSVMAAVSIKYMENPSAFKGNTTGEGDAAVTSAWSVTASNGVVTLPANLGTIEAPGAKAVVVDGFEIAKDTQMTLTIENSAIVARYGTTGTIANFANIAEDGKYDATTTGGTNN